MTDNFLPLLGFRWIDGENEICLTVYASEVNLSGYPCTISLEGHNISFLLIFEDPYTPEQVELAAYLLYSANWHALQLSASTEPLQNLS